MVKHQLPAHPTVPTVRSQLFNKLCIVDGVMLPELGTLTLFEQRGDTTLKRQGLVTGMKGGAGDSKREETL